MTPEEILQEADRIGTRQDNLDNLRQEVTLLEMTVNEQRKKYRAAHAESLLDGKPAPSIPKVLEADEKRLAQLQASLEYAERQWQHEALELKHRAINFYNALRNRIDMRLSIKITAASKKLAEALREMAELIGERSAAELITANGVGVSVRSHFVKSMADAEFPRAGVSAMSKELEQRLKILGSVPDSEIVAYAKTIAADFNAFDAVANKETIEC